MIVSITTNLTGVHPENRESMDKIERGACKNTIIRSKVENPSKTLQLRTFEGARRRLQFRNRTSFDLCQVKGKMCPKKGELRVDFMRTIQTECDTNITVRLTTEGKNPFPRFRNIGGALEIETMDLVFPRRGFQK